MQFLRFPILTGNAEAQVFWGGIVKRLLIAYFIGNISATKNTRLMASFSMTTWVSQHEKS